MTNKPIWGDKRSTEVLNFLTELRAFCKERGMSISHEDSHGSFEITEWNEHDDNWLSDANEI